MTSMLHIDELVKTYEPTRSAGSAGSAAPKPAVDQVDLDVAPGEFFTLLGPSGCGKTTILRSVAGLETPDSGTIAIGGVTVFGAAPPRFVPVHKREIGMVFQSYAIWPHMTVRNNVAFPIKVAGFKRSEVRSRVDAALEMVDLQDYADRPATALSGGQQQRVAFARAVVRNSKLLLLDEPLSNLDARLRTQMREELRSLQQRLGTTTLYVTHDQEEALGLSDRIAVMRDGQILEIGTPEQLYLRPQHAFTAQFVGQAQLWDVTVARREGSRPAQVDSPFGRLTVSETDESTSAATKLLIRPEHLQIYRTDGPAENSVRGIVRTSSFIGKIRIVDVEIGQQLVRCEELAGDPLAYGCGVNVHFPAERCVLVSGQGQLATPEELTDSIEPVAPSPPQMTQDRARAVLTSDRP